MVRDKTGGAPFRIIVPDFAKSAGTLMVLGADKVVMSDTSELGPIDPQIFAPDMYGQWRWLPTQSYLDAFEEHATILSNDPSNVPARIMIEKLDPPFLQLCRALKSRAQRLAEKHLREGMFRGGTGNTTKTASELLDTNRWLTHSQVISWRDAQAPPIELDVEYLEPQSDLWQKYWRLYCLQRLATSDRQILFESDYVSLPIDGPAG